MLEFFVVKNRSLVEKMPKETENVHVAFRPSDRDVFTIQIQCPNLKRFHIAPSYADSLSNTSRMFLEMKNVELIISNEFWGHRSDKNQYAVMKDLGK